MQRGNLSMLKVYFKRCSNVSSGGRKSFLLLPWQNFTQTWTVNLGYFHFFFSDRWRFSLSSSLKNLRHFILCKSHKALQNNSTTHFIWLCNVITSIKHVPVPCVKHAKPWNRMWKSKHAWRQVNNVTKWCESRQICVFTRGGGGVETYKHKNHTENEPVNHEWKKQKKILMAKKMIK